MSDIVPGHYHLAGVAGVGMSALAQVMCDAGYEVSGSDRFADNGRDTEVLHKLRDSGVRIVPQDGSGVNADTRALVVSTAIEEGNADIAAARAHGVPILHRADALAQLVMGKQCIAVTGTSGKSTVTGMLGWLLEQLGRDPTVVNGAPVVNWMSASRLGSVRWGSGGTWVIEADESDRSLLKFHPEHAIITNASADHFGMDETVALFHKFEMQVTGSVISGFGPASRLAGFSPSVGAGGSEFTFDGERYRVALPGRHNAENALLAIALCRNLGYAAVDIRAALSGFRGIHRRLERVGERRGVTVVDDYAHNPAKIRASWEALAPYHKHIHAVWRPHGYGPLRNMMEDIVGTFHRLWHAGDTVFILPVYDAGGTADRSVRSEDLVRRLESSGVHALAGDYDTVIKTLVRLAAQDDAVLVMGARDPDLPSLGRRILDGLDRGQGAAAR